MRAIQIVARTSEPVDQITLDFDSRYRRRIVLTGDSGFEFLLDLEHTSELRDGDDLLLEDGRHVRVIAASEALMRATCENQQHLMRTAWHIGNRHLPCELHTDCIVLRFDRIILDMLEKLGCKVTPIDAPFNPEGGAYGHGRTHGHSHGQGAHGDGHEH